jgi:hypothetical protein
MMAKIDFLEPSVAQDAVRAELYKTIVAALNTALEKLMDDGMMEETAGEFGTKGVP